MKLYTLIAGSFLMALSSLSFAVTSTDLTQNWTCTTNASSSDVAADKTADDKMASDKGGVDKAFSFASQNCRDCTKITCEASN